MRTTEQTAIQNYLDHSQSTHNSAVEASAAKLLIRLREVYQDNQKMDLTERDIQCLTNLLESKQAAVLASSSEENTSANEDRKSIAGIVQFIKYIKALPEGSYGTGKIQTVFEQIKSYMVWGEDHWSKNQFLNTQDELQVEWEVSASVAETLNLVCLASLDQQKTSDAAVRRAHVDSLFQCLLDLSPKDQMCTGGHQHDLLFLLNGWFEGMFLVEDINLFLHETTSLYLANCLKTDFQNPSELFQFVLNWVKSSYNAIVPEESYQKIKNWLNSKREELASHLLEACKKQGFRDKESSGFKEKIKMLIDEIEYVEPPSEIDSKTFVWMREVLKAKPILSRLGEMAVARNRTLEKAKAMIDRAQTFEEVECEALKTFLLMDALFQNVMKFESLTLFVSECEYDLKKLIETLQELLTRYFDGFGQEQDAVLLMRVEENKLVFFESIRQFQRDLHREFVENFFSNFKSVRVENNVEAETTLLMNLNLRNNQNQLILTDEILDRWLRLRDEQTAELTISVYELNRILLNALLVHPREWTLLFNQVLQIAVDWLDPAEFHESPSFLLEELRKSYSISFLRNLRLISLVVCSDSEVNELFYQKLSLFVRPTPSVNPFDDPLKRQINIISSNILAFQIQGLASEQFRIFWGTIKIDFCNDRIDNMPFYSFVKLVMNNPLDASLISAILGDIKEKINVWIPESYEDRGRMLLSLRQFSSSHRIQIMKAMKGKLARIIQGAVFERLFFYLNEAILNCEEAIIEILLTEFLSRTENIGLACYDSNTLLEILKCENSCVREKLKSWFQLKNSEGKKVLLDIIADTITKKIIFLLNPLRGNIQEAIRLMENGMEVGAITTEDLFRDFHKGCIELLMRSSDFTLKKLIAGDFGFIKALLSSESGRETLGFLLEMQADENFCFQRGEFNDIFNARIAILFKEDPNLLLKLANHPFFNWEEAKQALDLVDFHSDIEANFEWCLDLFSIAIREKKFDFVEALFDKLFEQNKPQFDRGMSQLLKRELHYNAHCALWKIIKKRESSESESITKYQRIWHQPRERAMIPLSLAARQYKRP